jgi:hypothetical protein
MPATITNHGEHLEIRLGFDGHFSIVAVDGKELLHIDGDSRKTWLGDGGQHTHPSDASHPDLATHNALGLATDAELGAKADAHAHPYEPTGTMATHAAAVDPHPTYLTGAEGNAAYAGTNDARLSDARAPTAHTHTEANVTNLTSDLAPRRQRRTTTTPYATAGHTHAGSQAFPVGALYLSVTNTNPATSLGYGTWSQVAQGSCSSARPAPRPAGNRSATRPTPTRSPSPPTTRP